MNITAIKAQVRVPGRYSVFVDGAYVCSLGAEALLDEKLVQGQELHEADIQRLRQRSAEDKAYALTLAYVTRRMRSRGELLDYSRRKNYPDDLSKAILAKLERLGLLDDTEFARRWVDNRRRLKSTSTKKLRLELRQKSIAAEVIDKVLGEDAAETADAQALRELIAKKRRQSRYQDDQKLIAYLARQGFRYDAIKSALSPDS